MPTPEQRAALVPSQGIDCSTPLTIKTAKAIAALGKKFVARYTVPAGYSKRLTRAEAEIITAAGMKIVSVFERTAVRDLVGATAGAADGAAAYKEVKALHQPEGTGIYFPVDHDANSKQYDVIEAFFRAAKKAIPGYLVGIYGEYEICMEMKKRGAVDLIWQTYAWSGHQFTALANIYQYKNDIPLGGIQVDLNSSYGNEGWWDTNPAKPAPQPKPPVEPQPTPEVTPLLAGADADEVVKLLQAAWNLTDTPEATNAGQDEIHRLADAVRAAAGLIKPVKKLAIADANKINYVLETAYKIAGNGEAINTGQIEIRNLQKAISKAGS